MLGKGRVGAAECSAVAAAAAAGESVAAGYTAVGTAGTDPAVEVEVEVEAGIASCDKVFLVESV
jgi:phage-related minor tail protein